MVHCWYLSFDYCANGGFDYLSLFLEITRSEDFDVLRSQLPFPNLMQELSRDADYHKFTGDLLDIGDRSGFGFLSMIFLCPSVAGRVLGVGGMASKEKKGKDEGIGSGISFSIPVRTRLKGKVFGSELLQWLYW